MFTVLGEEIQLECNPQRIWSTLDACLNNHPFTVHCSAHFHGHTSQNTDNSEMWSHCQSPLITLSTSCVTPRCSKCYGYCRHVTNCVYMFSFVYDYVPLYWSLATLAVCVNVFSSCDSFSSPIRSMSSWLVRERVKRWQVCLPSVCGWGEMK